MERDTFYFISPDKSPADFIESFRRFYGTTMNAFEAAEKDRKAEELQRQLLELAETENKSAANSLSIPATFLRVTVSV